jgi:hypothetical protein
VIGDIEDPAPDCDRYRDLRRDYAGRDSADDGLRRQGYFREINFPGVSIASLASPGSANQWETLRLRSAIELFRKFNVTFVFQHLTSIFRGAVARWHLIYQTFARHKPIICKA